MSDDETKHAFHLAEAYRDNPSIQDGPIYDLARAYLHLYAIHQSSQAEPVEEAQPVPGPAPSPPAPAAADWPCWPVFDANDSTTEVT